MVLRRETLLRLLLVLILLTISSGCATIIHPIEKSDIFSVEKGDKVITKSGQTISVEKDGWFLSDTYVEKVMRAKVKK